MNKSSDVVLNILYPDQHLQRSSSNAKADPQAKNVILDLIKYELELDHLHIAKSKTILIRINVDTVNNEVLKAW